MTGRRETWVMQVTTQTGVGWSNEQHSGGTKVSNRLGLRSWFATKNATQSTRGEAGWRGMIAGASSASESRVPLLALPLFPWLLSHGNGPTDIDT